MSYSPWGHKESETSEQLSTQHVGLFFESDYTTQGNLQTQRVLSHCSLVRLFVPMGYSCQAPLSMEYTKQEYWSGLPCPPPGDLAHPAIEPASTWIGRQIVYH